MNKVKELNYRISRWFFSNVLQNTLFTIILTAIVSSTFILYAKELFLNYYVLGALVLIIITYFIFSHEKTIKKVSLTEDSLREEWKNNEFRNNIPSTASINSGSLFLQFMDIPFTLQVNTPDSYALEFKAKMINMCFAWCLNVSIAGTNMRGYMFRYDPIRGELSPSFLMGFDQRNDVTTWLVPGMRGSPLKSVNNLILKDKEGWYFIRAEVYQYEATIKMPDLSPEQLRKAVSDQEGYEVTFERANTNKTVEIKIYDMNDLGRCIYHILYNEPPFKCFWGGKIGFRNYQFESALYRDVVIRRLS